VDNTNHKIKLSKVVSSLSTTVTIKKDYHLYTISSTCPEGYYRFKNNELVIIKNCYLNLYIDYNTLKTLNKSMSGLLDESDLVSVNREGLNQIYADLCYIPDFYRLLDSEQLRQLLAKKILAIVESANYSDKIQFKTEYDNYLKIMVTNFKIDKDNKVDVEEQIEESEGGWSYRLGS
jgi:hypothetical protein